MVRALGQRAVVVGGSMSGLMAARVLADHFEEVVVVERDPLEPDSRERRSAPQAHHFHTLLLGGQQVLEELFPGFVEDLLAAGSVRHRAGQSIVFHLPNGRAYNRTGSIREPRDLGFDNHSQSRGLLEACVRRRVSSWPGVSVRGATAVERLRCRDGRIRGVEVQGPNGEERLACDLVVDAGGRGSRAPRWLEEMGYPSPDETVIGVDFGYATTRFRIPEDHAPGDRRVGIFGPPPQMLRGALMEEIEDGLWLLSLGGRFGEYPPADEEGFLAFARSLHTPVLYEMIRDLERVSDIHQYRFVNAVRRRYEQLEIFPEGLLVVGDALCSVNPIYGQGMSVSGLQMRRLARLLQQRAEEGSGLDGVAGRFFREVAEVVLTPWLLASKVDFAYPQTRGQRPPELRDWDGYLSALDSLAAEDVEVHKLAARVTQLAEPLAALRREPLRERVLARMGEPREARV